MASVRALFARPLLVRAAGVLAVGMALASGGSALLLWLGVEGGLFYAFGLAVTAVTVRQMLAPVTQRAEHPDHRLSRLFERQSDASAGRRQPRPATEDPQTTHRMLEREEPYTKRHIGVLVVEGEEERVKERVDILVPAGTPLPCTVVRSYATVIDDQSSLVVKLVEQVGTPHPTTAPEHFDVSGTAGVDLPVGYPRGTPVEVQCDIDEEGALRMQVTAQGATTSAVFKTRLAEPRQSTDDMLQVGIVRSGSDTT